MGGGGVRSEETRQPAERTRGTKGDGRNEGRQQMGDGGTRRGNTTTSQTRGLEGARRVARVVSRHSQWLLDGEVRRDGSSTARDGVRRLLHGKRQRDRGSDGLRAQRRWASMDSAMAN